MKWNFRDAVFCSVLLACSSPGFTSDTVIYGLESAHAFHSKPRNGEYYIQVGSFLNKEKALHYQRVLQSKTNYPVTVEKKAKYNVINIGPLKSSADVRTAADEVLIGKQAKVYYHPAPQPMQLQHHYIISHEDYAESTAVTTAPVNTSAHGRRNWFIGVNVGLQQPQNFNANNYLNNGSGFPAPFNTDIYSTHTKGTEVTSLFLGYRWERESIWLAATSVGIQYKNLLASNVGGSVMQYSSPEFNNYNYTDYISSNVILAFTKINFVRLRTMSPYFKAGLGCAFNRSSDYHEAAVPDVTPRTSPSFASKTTSQFAFNVGAGVDFQISHNFIVTAGYEYLNLGHVASGNGTDFWSGQHLNFGSYHTNEAFLGMTLLLGN